MIRSLALVVAALACVACPAGQGPSPSSQPAAEKKAAAPAAGKPAPAKPAAAKPTAKPPVGVPAAVVHVDNAKWEDKPTPTDMPALDTKAAAVVSSKAATDHAAALAAACAAGADRVVRLDAATSRVGYESYKNGNLPVKGKFNTVGGHAVLGAQPSLHFWADVLSLNSGDPVRDARLLKLFFEAEKPGNAVLRFEADALTGLADGKIPAGGGLVKASGKLTLHGVSTPMTLGFKLTPGKAPGQWKAALAEETLLPFAPHALADPLKALLVACNHKSMGSSVKLEFDLNLSTGCK